MNEDKMETYKGATASLKRWIMRQRVKVVVAKMLFNNSSPSIKYDVGCAWDTLYGRTGGVLPSQTTNSIPNWVISNEGIRALRSIGYDLCDNCSGGGWDADWGGAFICDRCEGKGIVQIKKG